ncbi:uncharacterized protein IL334_000120 [Kwoniella shivajii]|uniref:Hypervirulence associated protein TUDOR domain-containing protein n=1 Tax=Kwoniella shivajii TaxID=564305 RepID=A0ABZ1CN92_9TREE|nr:hypothetical protein IL334_000120 [Kwoniella shivajii]
MADPNSLPPLPKDHLDHPEQWATGAEPATGKQKGFIAVLENKNPGLIPEEGLDKDALGKSEASEIIDSLIKGEKVNQDHNQSDGEDTNGASEKAGKKETEPVNEEQEKPEEKVGEKRKASSTTVEDEPILSNKKNNETKQEGTDETSSSKDDEMDGKDLKDSKQTTLDGVFGKDSTSKNDEVEKEEKENGNEDRATKKPRLDDATSPVSKQDISSKQTQPPTSEPPTTSVSDDVAPATKENDTIPGSPSHLDHPENWATGDDPATEKQKGFIKVLEKQKGTGGENVDGLGKSEASEKIEELKDM